MNNPLLSNLLDPAILFFFFGLFAALVRSNLEIPGAISKFFSLYLLMAVGFKGGVAIAQSGFSSDMLLALGLAMLLALVIPAYSYAILRRKIPAYDAAAIAATYGSVSAVTFITATSFLTRQGVEFGGYMAVALVVMESPAIIMAVLLANLVRQQDKGQHAAPVPFRELMREAFTDGAHLLLLGGLVIGAITGEAGKKVMDPFTGDLFKGILAFFLLDMGLLVAKRLREFRSAGRFLTGFGIVVPQFNAALALTLAKLTGLSSGDAFLLCVLAASASYIVVPAVIKYAIPEANPTLYFSMSLVITFPFNILLGIPLYFSVVQAWFS